jgi:hypothetical protein
MLIHLPQNRKKIADFKALPFQAESKNQCFVLPKRRQLPLKSPNHLQLGKPIEAKNRAPEGHWWAVWLLNEFFSDILMMFVERLMPIYLNNCCYFNYPLKPKQTATNRG